MKQFCVARFAALFRPCLLLTLAVVTGCHSTPLPTVLSEKPTADEIRHAVTQNSQKIKTLAAPNATLGAVNVPGWAKCHLAFERPGRIRVMGTANMMGRVFDAGANDELIWYWDKFQEPQQLAWCKKSEYTNSVVARESIPIDPTWLPEAIGLVEFNEKDTVEGPIPQMDKTLLLISKRNYMGGVYSKYTYIEPKSAAVKRQDLQDPQGNVLFSVVVNEFQVETTHNVILPKRLSISSPQTKESIHLDLGTVQVNGTAIPRETFQIPKSEDLGNVPSVNIGAQGAPLAAKPVPVNQSLLAQKTPAAPVSSSSALPAPSAPSAIPSPTASVGAASSSRETSAPFQIRAVAN